jgi:hypothetical protein
MKGIDSTGAPLVHVSGWVGGWMGRWMEVKAVLRIAYSNQKVTENFCKTNRIVAGEVAWSSSLSCQSFPKRPG